MLSYWAHGRYGDMPSFGIKTHHFFQSGYIKEYLHQLPKHMEHMRNAELLQSALTWVKFQHGPWPSPGIPTGFVQQMSYLRTLPTPFLGVSILTFRTMWFYYKQHTKEEGRRAELRPSSATPPVDLSKTFAFIQQMFQWALLTHQVSEIQKCTGCGSYLRGLQSGVES